MFLELARRLCVYRLSRANHRQSAEYRGCRGKRIAGIPAKPLRRRANPGVMDAVQAAPQYATQHRVMLLGSAVVLSNRVRRHAQTLPWRGRHRRWRRIPGTAPVLIGRRTHSQDQLSALGNIGMAEPRFVPLLSVECGGLNVNVFRRVMTSHNSQVATLAHMYRRLIEERTA